MKREILIAVVLTFIQTISFSQQKAIEFDNLKKLNLKGRVKTINEKSFVAVEKQSVLIKMGTGWQYDWQKDGIYTFDTFGNLLTYKHLIGSNAKVVKSNKFDDKNRIAVINRFLKTIYVSYDSLDRVIATKEIEKLPNEIVNRNTKSTFPLEMNLKYYYDSQNLLIRNDGYKKGIKNFVEIFLYDSMQNCIFSELKMESYKETTKNYYDERNHLVKSELSDNKEGLLELITYEYQNDILIHEHTEYYEEGILDGTIDEKFENGNSAEVIERNSNGKITEKTKSSYEFDSKGNWIKKTLSVNGKFFIVEREIVYF